MNITIEKGNASEAEIRLPSSKSLTHRILIAASLASGTSVIKAPACGDDIDATVSAIMHAGAQVRKEAGCIYVTGKGFPQFDGEVIDVRESASTLRFMIPPAALCRGTVRFSASGRLPERPQTVYEELFAEKGLRFFRKGALTEVSGVLEGGTFSVRGDISSQFISGLLFALPLCEKDSVIRIREPFVSAPYVRLTADVLHQAGIDITMQGNEILIPGGQKYRPLAMEVPADMSQAAIAAMIPYAAGIPVTLRAGSEAMKQGDSRVIDVIRRMGGIVRTRENAIRFEPSSLHAVEYSLSDCPDLGPALFALASLAEGTSVFTGTERLRWKECDRVKAMEEEMKKLGCDITSGDDSVTVTGKPRILSGQTLSSHRDHRVAMALSMLALAAEGKTEIKDAESVSKSWPDFYETMIREEVFRQIV